MKLNKISFLLFVFILCFQLLGCQQNQQPTLEEKIAQMVMIGFRGTEISENHPIVNDIKNLKIGGVILFEYDVPSGSRPRNITSSEQLQKICSDLQNFSENPLLIAIDQEGGKVNRLKTQYGFPQTVSQQYLGTIDNIDSTKKHAQQTAEQLHQLGINLNFAPCVDVNINPDCPVIGKIERSFSSDPMIVAKHSSIVINELRQQNIKSCVKHFPGHGSSSTDSHLGFTDVSKTWNSSELIPYKVLIENNLCDAIMSSHVFLEQKDSLYPATLSKNIIQGLLRDSLGWHGVVFSDDMNMEAITSNFDFEEAIILAVNSGVDILVYGNNSKREYDEHLAQKVVDVMIKAVKNNKISENRIDESYQRIKRFHKFH